MQRGTRDQVEAFENDISNDLASVRDKVQQAASSLGRPATDAAAEALDRAGQLARGLESLERRTRDRAQAGQAQGNASDQGEPGSGAPGSGSATGQPSTGGGGSVGRNGGGWGGFSPEEVRQFRGEIRQWSAEAQDLARQLGDQDVDTTDLDEVLRGLRALDNDRVFRDVSELARLENEVAEGAKRFEFQLRRQQGQDAAPASLSSADEVPERFRGLVEEYYRALASRPAQQ